MQSTTKDPHAIACRCTYDLGDSIDYEVKYYMQDNYDFWWDDLDLHEQILLLDACGCPHEDMPIGKIWWDFYVQGHTGKVKEILDREEKKVYEMLWEDYDFHQRVWGDWMDWVNSQFTEWGDHHNFRGRYVAEGFNLDWRGSSGRKIVELNNWGDMAELLGRLSDFEPDVIFYENGEILFTYYHHDCPTGSQIHFTPLAEGEELEDDDDE
jgi:hypothetical protein